jgi:hypothetical protein
VVLTALLEETLIKKEQKMNLKRVAIICGLYYKTIKIRELNNNNKYIINNAAAFLCSKLLT